MITAEQIGLSREGFYSDINPKKRHFRLSVDSTTDGWQASVFDMDSKTWIMEGLWAVTADEAKTSVADFTRSFVHYIGPIDWHRQ
jgi:hypothetical protein